MLNKGFGNGKATLDNGYGVFLSMVAYKQADKGHLLIEADAYYPSSQICHACGHRQKLTLSDRIYICPNCGLLWTVTKMLPLTSKMKGYASII